MKLVSSHKNASLAQLTNRLLQTKHASELCALLVDDIYGELPSRLISALLTKGRSTTTQLVRYTALPPKLVKHGLVVLLQNNLLYHDLNHPSRQTWYEANAMACYNILRIGKLVNLMDERYGNVGKTIVETLFQYGHIKVLALEKQIAGDINDTSTKAREIPLTPNGTFELYTQSPQEIQSCLQILLRDEVIEVIGPKSFQNLDASSNTPASDNANPNDSLRDIKIDEKKQPLLGKRLREAQDALRSSGLDNDLRDSRKKRRLGNGHSDSVWCSDLDDKLGPDDIIRLNSKNCLLYLRNQSLASLVGEAFGDITGKVYHCVLDLITLKEADRRRRCDDTEGERHGGLHVNTIEVLNHLDSNINLASGIGKVNRDLIDLQSADRVRKAPNDSAQPTDGHDSSHNSDSSDSELDQKIRGDHANLPFESSMGSQRASRSHITPSQKSGKVTFVESAEIPDNNIEYLLLHLRLLSESRQQFLRHCGKGNSGKWTVDFPQLLLTLRQAEVDAVIGQFFGRYGLRVTRILRERGMMDEKSLMQAALMQKPDIQAKLSTMQAAGVVEVQEVPRDNSRLASRTIFFWFFDGDRCQTQLLDNIYKVMVRCLQTLQVERHKIRAILSFVNHKDVRGKEEEVMRADHLNKYHKHLEVQKKLLAQIMRLDKIVAILRDY